MRNRPFPRSALEFLTWRAPFEYSTSSLTRMAKKCAEPVAKVQLVCIRSSFAARFNSSSLSLTRLFANEHLTTFLRANVLRRGCLAKKPSQAAPSVPICRSDSNEKAC